MRLDYVPDPPNFQDEESRAIEQRVRERRRPRGLTPLDRTLLHAPPVADGWNSFLKSVRTQTSLSTSIRETAICRIAAINRAWFEWAHHEPLLQEAGVLKEAAVQLIKDASPRTFEMYLKRRPQWMQDLMDDAHLAVLAYTDAMTVDVRVPEHVFGSLKKCFGEREVVEITATVGAYNCVSRFLVALDVGECNRAEDEDMKGTGSDFEELEEDQSGKAGKQREDAADAEAAGQSVMD